MSPLITLQLSYMLQPEIKYYVRAVHFRFVSRKLCFHSKVAMKPLFFGQFLSKIHCPVLLRQQKLVAFVSLLKPKVISVAYFSTAFNIFGHAPTTLKTQLKILFIQHSNCNIIDRFHQLKF